MATRTKEEILAGSGAGSGINIKHLVGQTLTIVDFTTRPSTKYPGRTFVNFNYITPDGEEGEGFTSAVAILNQLEELEAIDELPAEVLVDTYPTDKGNPGFVFRNLEA